VQHLEQLGRLAVSADSTVTFQAAVSDSPCALPNPGDDPNRPSIPGYEIISGLGHGGMGVVYKARQLCLNRIVALKVILNAEYAREEERRRFRTEAEAVARLQHSNIVQVFEIGENNGTPFFTLEYCGGGSLAGQLRGKPLLANEAAQIVETLAHAVQAAHAKGIIHRDLKPANVLRTEDGTLNDLKKRELQTPDHQAGVRAAIYDIIDGQRVRVILDTCPQCGARNKKQFPKDGRNYTSRGPE
jgi:serine/threonine-protein kinase